jgi:hypothetical protein
MGYITTTINIGKIPANRDINKRGDKWVRKPVMNIVFTCAGLPV